MKDKLILEMKPRSLVLNQVREKKEFFAVGLAAFADKSAAMVLNELSIKRHKGETESR